MIGAEIVALSLIINLKKIARRLHTAHGVNMTFVSVVYFIAKSAQFFD